MVSLLPAIISALFIGVLLSVLGSGGSILTVPILLYIIEMSPDLAIASSLAVVGLISIVSSIRYIRTSKVEWPLVLLFGLPGMAGTYIGAWLGTTISNTIQLSIFVTLMFVAAVLMFKKSRATPTESATLNSSINQAEGLSSPNTTDSSVIENILLKRVVTLTQGFFVGIVTGVVGVGGGFLIVPALVLLARLPINIAIGTSLLIIAINSAVGFTKYYLSYSAMGIEFDWKIIFILVLGGIVGSLAGASISKKLPTNKLQQIFAGFLVFMASFILIKSIL
jgi:uncharacterized protein